MRTKNIFHFVILLIVLLSEVLPNGVVLNFANPEGEPWRRTFSYFSLTPFGYADFAPFITAILTVMLLILSIIFLVKKKSINSVFKIISGTTAVISVFPMLYGVEYITITGIVITVLLSINFVFSLIKTE